MWPPFAMIDFRKIHVEKISPALITSERAIHNTVAIGVRAFLMHHLVEPPLKNTSLSFA